MLIGTCGSRSVLLSAIAGASGREGGGSKTQAPLMGLFSRTPAQCPPVFLRTRTRDQSESGTFVAREAARTPMVASTQVSLGDPVAAVSTT